jgi:multidrug efflux pump subunit AcrB
MNHKKQFGISTWAINNRVTVYIMTAIIVIAGSIAYVTMPREDFPEIIENKIYITSVYPGNSAEDLEKLVTKPLEKKIKGLSGVEKITSSSYQDFSMIIAEFSEEFTVDQAKQKVKDEVDLAKSDNDWPTLDNGGKVSPTVFNINIAEENPILNINLKGDYTAQQLKQFGEDIKDDIEDIAEVKKVDILGVGTKEVEIAIDVYKMTASKVGFDDVQRAVQGENITLSGGNLTQDGNQSNIRIVGEIKNPEELNNIVVKAFGGVVLLRDIATIEFKEKERTTFAREKGEEVVMLSVKKRSGKNMITAIEQIKEKIKEAQEDYLPKDVSVEFTGDQSHRVEHSVDELSNHIIFGIVLVMLVLMFTMGLRNSLFVGSAIPLSMLMAFAFLSWYGVTLNTMVLFALVMGLGMLVDDGIVVVDNVFANMQKGMNRIDASKYGIGEIAWPVISSTATTLAAFFPLGLWPGTMGKFMIYFPATLSVVLTASLIVAMIINASMTAGFMDLRDENIERKDMNRYSLILFGIGLLFAIPGYIFGNGALRGIGHLALLSIGFMWFYHKFLFRWTQDFQHSFFPRLEEKYSKYLGSLLHDKKPRNALFGIIILLILSFVLVGVFPRKVLFFPDNIPNMNIVYVEYPQGTDINKTNEAVKKVEKQVLDVLKRYTKPYGGMDFLVQSVTSQVGEGGGNVRMDIGNSSEMPYKGKVTVLYHEFKERKKINTQDILDTLRATIAPIPGAKITIEKEQNGPPSGYPISIELKGEDYEQMLVEAEKMIEFINSKKIKGIEQLGVDVNKDKPELRVNVDRVAAGNLSTSTALVGFTLRRAVYGQEIDNYKEGDDDYEINMRLQDSQRKDASVLFNQSMTFRNQNNGQMMQIPITTIATTENTKTFNQIKRRDNKRVLTVYSNVLNGFNANEINKQIKQELKSYKFENGVSYRFSGEQEEQAKNQNFLGLALLYALIGVATIIILQFNSTSKTVIIMATILLSFSGVFLGYVFTNMDFVILMTMMGIISLAGVVVKNGIVLMDFFVLLLDEKVAERGVEKHDDLSIDDIRDVIVESGKSRLRPVLLTATTAVLGLIPLAIGLNFNFFTFLSDLNPHIYLGGDNVIFWGPLAWTIIFGLTYATILTLIMVPVMFYMVSVWKHNIRKRKLNKIV